MEIITVKLIGISPLLMHGDRFSNPLDPLTKGHKVLTSKRKKTEEDHLAIARSEWMGSLYHDETLGPYMPTVNIKSAMVGGAKLSRLGSAFKRACLILDDKAKLNYPGPRKPGAMWDDGRFTDARSVVVSQSRLMRYRPKFDTWETESFDILYDPETLDRDQVVRALETAGKLIGIGDYRPDKGGTFGRFDVEVL